MSDRTIKVKALRADIDRKAGRFDVEIDPESIPIDALWAELLDRPDGHERLQSWADEHREIDDEDDDDDWYVKEVVQILFYARHYPAMTHYSLEQAMEMLFGRCEVQP